MAKLRLILVGLVATGLLFAVGGCVTKAEHEKLVAELGATTSELVGAKGQLSSTTTELERAKTKAAGLDKALGQAQESLLGAQAAHDKEKAELQSRLQSAELEKGALNKRLGELGKQLETSEERAKVAEGKLKQLSENQLALQMTLADLEAQYRKLEAELKEMQQPEVPEPVEVE